MTDFDPVAMAERNTRLAAERDAAIARAEAAEKALAKALVCLDTETETLRRVDEAEARAAVSRVEINAMTAVFDRMYAADMRGIKAWQKAHPGKELVWPDKGKLVEWLLDRIVELKDKIDDLNGDIQDMVERT